MHGISHEEREKAVGQFAKIMLCISFGCFIACCVVADFVPDHSLVDVYSRASFFSFLLGLLLAGGAMLANRVKRRRADDAASPAG